MKAVPQRRAPDQTVHGIDRMIRNVETGRFERSLSALTAAMAVAERAADRMAAGAGSGTC